MKRRTLARLLAYAWCATLGIVLIAGACDRDLDLYADWSSLYILSLFITWAIGSQVTRLK